MYEYLIVQGVYLLRILLAALCGWLIGYERENNLKMAGVRTHTIVAVTSALMMLISKYGFYDILHLDNIGLDPSRIAASIVTAIGFLGAGVIFTKNLNVSGLTTAAGIWATVGIGMSLGAGMYMTGICCTVFLLLLQFLLHRNLRINRSSVAEKITIRLPEAADIHAVLENTLTAKRIRMEHIKVSRLPGGMLEIVLDVLFPTVYNIDDVLALLKEVPEIESIDL